MGTTDLSAEAIDEPEHSRWQLALRPDERDRYHAAVNGC
jgi:hypothetical protein